MLRSLGLLLASAVVALGSILPVSANANERTLPMRFDLRMHGSADGCSAKCEAWISASGAITAESARDFIQFARGRDLANATVVLDSDGGSVLGALALGREIRRLALNTTVGRTVDLPRSSNNEPRTALLPRADCESMCAFVLLAGIRRTVPVEARVMVHQIWLGDRREDPTAANYSAEDLVLVQRDIGRLARYTAEMGASIDLLDFALRIPPWEPMKALTRAELRNTKLTTEDSDETAAATLAASPPAAVAAPPAPRVTDGARAAPISQQRWAMVDRSGTATLARHHPLTVEGETIGSFDLSVTCGSDSATYDVSYRERRRSGEQMPVPVNLAPDIAHGRDVVLRHEPRPTPGGKFQF